MDGKNKGFVLVETLIVSVFIMVILSLLYANMFPIVAEYEKRTYYDSVSSKYVAHWARKMILDKGTPEIFALVDGYLDVTDCAYYKDTNFCETFKSVNHITKIYLTDYNIATFKNYVETSNRFTGEFLEYLNVLPDYPDKVGVYRVLVEMKDPAKEMMASYGTIEVKK